jgi:branched-chain amino acid transport system permease protein
MLAGQILNGLVSGAMYALVAIGFTLVVGVLDKLNFTHPEVFMLGGFVGLVTLQHLPVGWAFVFAFLVGGLLGLFTEFVAFRRFQSADSRITAALSSLALGLVITDLTHKVWGTEQVPLPQQTGWLSKTFSIAGVHFLNLQLMVLAVTLVLMAGLHVLIHRMKLGRQIRALAEAPTSAALLGINVLRVKQSVFFISSALAAVAGLMLALRSDAASPEIGLTFGLKAMAIMAIGGMGDLRGAVLAGLLIGMIEALMFYFDLGRLGEMTVWLAMILILLWRPAGLFSGGLHSREQRV